ncbi:MAG: HPr family phosphocarrier protein, partial [Candidatus Omnitrophica bacterium]|nr:HPr family phosphocarrier protein [Candidatus Omnitrophota bacterium]
SLETRLPHDGVVRSDDGSYWIVKSKGYDSARGDVKNEGRRERLAYLMAERAGVPVAEVRRITPNQAVSLGFPERDAESKYLVRIVERGNYALQRKTNTPASNRAGIWALDLLTRRYDHHIDNYGFAGEETDDPDDPDGGVDSMVAVDMDEGLKPKTFIDTDQSTAVMKYTGSHAEHSILMPFETLLTWLGLNEKDIQYDLNRAYQARESGRDNVRRWNEAVARLAKKYRLIDAFMEAEGIRPGQIRAAVAHLQAVLDRESILKMAEEAGYSEAEAAGIADWLNDNLKSLDDHAREYWSIMNDEAPLADPAVKEESAGQPSAEGARMAENQASAGRHWDNLIDRSPARADRIKRSILADDPIKRDLEKMGADIDRIFLLPFYGVGQASFGFGRRPLRDGGWDQRSGATHMTAQSDLLKEDMIGLIRRREASGEQRLVLAQAGLGDIQNETADLIELIREAFEAVGAEMDGWDINLILLDLDPAIVDRARDKFGALSGPVRMHYHSIDLLDSAAMDALSERLSIVVRPGVDYFLTRNVFYENTVADAMAAFALPTAGKYEDRLKHWTSASSYAEDGERYGFTQLISLTLALKNIMRYFGRAALGETPGTHYLIDPVPAYERRARAVFAPAGMTSVGDPLLGVLELTDGSQVEGLGLYSAQSGFRVIDTAHSGPEPAAARMAVGMGDWTLDKYVRDLEKRGVDRRVAMAMVEAFDREVREYYADDPDLGQDRLREAINAVDIESIGRLLITSALSGLLFGAAMLFVNGWNLAHSFKTSAVIFGLTILTVNMSRSFEARQSLGPNGTRQFGMFAPNLYYFKGVYVDNCRLMLRKYFDLIEADGGNSGRGSQRPTSGARMSEWEYQPVFARIKPGERTAAFAHRVWQVLTREEPARYFKWADLAMSAGADRESRDTAIMNDEKDVRRLLLSHPDDPLQLELGYGANRDGQLHIPLMRAVAEVLESHARQGVSADEEGLLEDLRLRIRSLFGNARTAEVEIKIRRGLHARPSAHIASFTSELEDEIDARIFFESVDDEEDGPRNASSSADIGGLESEKRVRVTVVSHLSDADADAIHKVYEGLLHASPDSSSYGVEWGPFTSVIDEIASRNPKRSAGARMAEVNERTEPDREALATSLIDHYSMNVDAARQRAEEVRQGSWTRVGNDFVLMDGNGKRAVVVSEMGTRRFFDTNGRWMLTIDPNGNKIDELEWDASGKFKRAWT